MKCLLKDSPEMLQSNANVLKTVNVLKTLNVELEKLLKNADSIVKDRRCKPVFTTQSFSTGAAAALQVRYG